MGGRLDGDARAALETWRRLAEIDPYCIEALEGIWRHDPEAALPMLAAAVPTIGTDEAWALLAKARLYARQGDAALEAFLNLRSDEYLGWWSDGIGTVAPGGPMTVRQRERDGAPRRGPKDTSSSPGGQQPRSLGGPTLPTVPGGRPAGLA